MTIITKELLKKRCINTEYIKFFEINFPKELFPNGLNLNNIKVTGDYKGYFDYISNLPEIQYDLKGNCIKTIHSDGSIYETIFKYDHFGRLIQVNDCYIEYI
jgi:hypothetical protein